MIPVTQRTFCSNSLFSQRIFCKQSAFAIFTILNDNNSQLKQWFHKNDRFFTQNIRKLFVGCLRKQRYCGNRFSILCVKIQSKTNCASILGNDNKHGRNWINCLNTYCCDLWCMQCKHDSREWFWLVNTYTDACHAMRRWKTTRKTLVSGYSLPCFLLQFRK